MGSNITTITNIIIILVFTVGAVLLQLFLSKRKSKWYGYILPVISIAFSVLTVFNNKGSSLVSGSLVQNTLIIISSFITANIRTIILIAIHLYCRDKIKRNSQIQKMNIQDL